MLQLPELNELRNDWEHGLSPVALWHNGSDSMAVLLQEWDGDGEATYHCHHYFTLTAPPNQPGDMPVAKWHCSADHQHVRLPVVWQWLANRLRTR